MNGNVPVFPEILYSLRIPAKEAEQIRNSVTHTSKTCTYAQEYVMCRQAHTRIYPPPPQLQREVLNQ